MGFSVSGIRELILGVFVSGTRSRKAEQQMGDCLSGVDARRGVVVLMTEGQAIEVCL